MRIHSIEIEGLWAYRERVHVDVSDLPLVVAVGDNGAGKSALFVSAVIAAFYGKLPTRTTAESVTDGTTRGSVNVAFDIDGHSYQVSRTFPTSGNGTAALRVRRGDGWKVVTEKGIREVTAKVTELVGMPYETAVMTWIAEQGAYGKFSAATPGERFALLSGVFGLDEYAVKHKKAISEVKKAAEQAATARGRITELNDTLVTEDAAPSAHDAVTDEELAARLTAAGAAVDTASAAAAAHQAVSPQAAADAAAARAAAIREVREAHLAAATAALSAARDDRESAAVRRTRAVSAAEDTLTQAREAEGTVIARAEAQAAAGAEAATRVPEWTAASAAAVRERDNELSAATTADEEAARIGNDKAALRTEFAHVKQEADDAAAALTELDGVAGHEATCRACGQHITPAVAERFRTQTQAALDAARARMTEINASGLALAESEKAQRDAAVRARANAASAGERAADADRKLAEANAAVSAADAYRDTIADSRARLDAAEAAHAEAVAAAEAALAAELAEITERGQAAAADVNTHQTASAEETAAQEAADAAAQAASGDTAHAAETARLEAVHAAAQAVAADLQQETWRRARLAEQQAAVRDRIAEATAALDAASASERIHTELASAYAPSGIPSMILESVIDELNTAVNDTLATLSAGELRVSLSTGRTKADGGTESKVTVYVETGSGVRAYEALSGGQRFRVDLAIRLGLSAVIAAGTGTPIGTFILDEGWGSLDAEGVKSTLDVLHALSEQVNVLTVSHIAGVRDSIPARVEVTNTEGTSRAVVAR